MESQLIDPKAHKQLFLDDHAIDRTFAIKRNMHKPTRKGAVITPERAIGQTRTAAWSPPLWNPDISLWEWWYKGHYDETGNFMNQYATSEDGINWDRPSLGLYEWQGSKDNNIALDPEGMGLIHILRDDRDPDPARRYKGLFSNRDRHLGVSPDGFQWDMLDVPPIPSQDTAKFMYDPYTEQFVATVKHRTAWGRSVWVSTSKDFNTFTEPRLVMHSDEIDRENRRIRVREIVENPAYFTPPIVDDVDYIAEIYLMPIMAYEGIYVGFPNLFNPFGAVPAPRTNYTRINQPELAMSRDLYNWDRVADREVFLSVLPWDGVTYDTSQMSICGAPIVRDDEIRIYYNSYRVAGYKDLYETHNRNKELFRLDIDPEVFNDTGAMSLATLRLDGFVSLDAEDVGVVLTKPFMIHGEDLYVNVDAKWGDIRVEIVDAEPTVPSTPAPPQGGPDTLAALPGYGFVEAVPVSGDHVRVKLRWEGSPNPNFDKPVQARFLMNQARLYSFWLGAAHA
jgi:hypothetical protein